MFQNLNLVLSLKKLLILIENDYEYFQIQKANEKKEYYLIHTHQ